MDILDKINNHLNEGKFKVGDRIQFNDVKDSVSSKASSKNKKMGTIVSLKAGNLAIVKFDGSKKNATINLNQATLNEAKKEDDEINWKYHFEQFGGQNKFLKATGIKKEDLRMYISTGEVPESARKMIRKAVATRLIGKYRKNG